MFSPYLLLSYIKKSPNVFLFGGLFQLLVFLRAHHAGGDSCPCQSELCLIFLYPDLELMQYLVQGSNFLAGVHRSPVVKTMLFMLFSPQCLHLLQNNGSPLFFSNDIRVCSELEISLDIFIPESCLNFRGFISMLPICQELTLCTLSDFVNTPSSTIHIEFCM